MTSKWAKPLPADEIIGYSWPAAFDEDGDILHSELFRCEYHDRWTKDDGWTPVTVADTWKHYYQCDRMGCELSWHEYPIKEN